MWYFEVLIAQTKVVGFMILCFVLLTVALETINARIADGRTDPGKIDCVRTAIAIAMVIVFACIMVVGPYVVYKWWPFIWPILREM